MRLLLILISLFSFEAYASSYGDLASSNIIVQLDKVLNGLDQFLEDSNPQSVKEVRKDIGKLKIFLDVFTYAYKGSKLLKIRNKLDYGYEVIGHFKDLYDTFDPKEITKKILNERRDKALKWKDSFLYKFHSKDYYNYLKEPLINKTYKRKKSKLPKFFWAIVKFPKKKIEDGDKVLKALLNGMSAKAENRLSNVLKLKDLFTYERENEYHDFRKLVRSHLKLVDVFFIKAVESDHEVQRIKSDLLNIISHFGDLNDLLVKLHHVNEKPKRKKIKSKVSSQWSKLKNIIIKNKIKEKLNNFRI